MIFFQKETSVQTVSFSDVECSFVKHADISPPKVPLWSKCPKVIKTYRFFLERKFPQFVCLFTWKASLKARSKSSHQKSSQFPLNFH